MHKDNIQLKSFKEFIGNDNAKLFKLLEIVNEISKWLDNRVQMSDQIYLSLFAFDEAWGYYTNDKSILYSTRLVNFFKEKHSKSIKELS